MVVDTNVISETIQPRPDHNVISWLAERPRADIAISIVSVAEIREGIVNTISAQREQLAYWVESTMAMLGSDQVLPLDDTILMDWLRLSRKLAQQQMTRQAPDLLLAATARVHDLTIATRNARDFTSTGVTVYNPWTAQPHRMETP